MALVAYDSSSGSEDDNDYSEELSSKITKSSEGINQDKELNFKNNKNDNTNNKNLKLPKPSDNDKSKLINNLSASKDSGGKIRIFLPSYKSKGENEFEEDDDDEKEFKKYKFASTKGSGLKSMLPPPKNKQPKATSFLPDVLKRKAEQPTGPAKKATTSKSIELDDDNYNESVDFFSFDKEDERPIKNLHSTSELSVQPNKFETDLLNKFGKPTSSTTVNANRRQVINQSAETEYQKERKLKLMMEKRFGEEVSDDVQIQEINIANHINDNLDYIKSVSLEKEAEVKGPMPSHTAKKKHQITYLAYQAKQNEVKLKNEWAQGKINRMEARSKYGF